MYNWGKQKQQLLALQQKTTISKTFVTSRLKNQLARFVECLHKELFSMCQKNLCCAWNTRSVCKQGAAKKKNQIKKKTKKVSKLSISTFKKSKRQMSHFYNFYNRTLLLCKKKAVKKSCFKRNTDLV